MFVVAVGMPEVEGEKDPCVLEADEGKLASFVTEETGCGTVIHPWLIRVSSGHRINVTMLDFGIAQRDPDFDTSMSCKVYAMIREEGKNSVSVCASDKRFNSVYSSNTSQVEITMITREDADTTPGFMISYKAFVCIFYSFLYILVFKK